ncbi:hypothetical protein [Crateriforma conspicua]|uniref:hypothetical protein n=1 Tax=Crateriforma conspicua TaxID=2527996 RepID=UPI00118956A7|nr:hypothetical protein [Crateriforma conspicua]QDV61709.1 hypothetical protein Mal65_08360 [Crateriforma conspicua]
MDAVFRSRRTGGSVCLALGWMIWLLMPTSFATAAKARTINFMVDAPTPQLAQQVARSAEKYRQDLAMHWLGRVLPDWPSPCPINVVAGNYPAQGVTTYNPQPVRDFRMEVVGTPQRILDSVLPHEITHTVLATHFGRPLPRWADEGICTTVEHPDEKRKHEIKLREFLHTRRGIKMNELFLMKEYPSDILPMYAQGYSVCRFLIAQKDARTFIRFLDDYMKQPSWTQNVRKHYGYESLRELQENWLAWVADGSGDVDAYVKSDAATSPVTLAAATNTTRRNDPPSVRLAGATEPAPSGDGGTAGRGWYLRNRDNPAATASASSASASANPASPQTAAAEPGRSSGHASTPIQTPPSGTALSAIAPPPSVRGDQFYSTAHPQAEQRIARGDFPAPAQGQARALRAGDMDQDAWRGTASEAVQYDAAAARYLR